MIATSRIGACLLFVLAAVCVLVCDHTTNAAVTTWSGSQTPNLNWSQSGNWIPGVPGTSDTAAFGNTGSHVGSVGTVTNVVDASRTIAEMIFSNTTGNTHTTTLGVNTLTITGSLVVNKNLGASGTNVATVASVAGQTLNVGTGTAGDELLLGRVDGTSSQSNTQPRGELDLSGLAMLNVDVANVYLGVNDHSDSQSNVQVSGRLVLSASNSITATRFWVGQSPSPGQHNVTSSVVFGAGNSLNVDDLLIGGVKSHGTATIVSGGTLALVGKTSGSANLRIADNNSGTGVSGSGTLDLSGGTFNATLNQLVIGRRGSGTGTGVGSLIMDAGTVSAVTVQLGIGNTTASGTITMNGGTFTVTNGVASGPGASAINVNGGAMNVSGGLQVDSLAVGMEGRTGTVTATGAVQIGASTASHTLDVGRRTTAVTGTTVGTLNLTGADSVTMALKSLRLGTNSTTHVAGQGPSRGTLLLSASNTIDAESIIVSDAFGTGNTGQQSKITLGTDNTIRSDLIVVAGRKGDGLIDIVSGGALTLSGLGGERADVHIGHNHAGTGVISVGHFDLRGASPSTSLLVGNMVLGSTSSNSTGSGNSGTFSMNAGTVDITTLTMAEKLGASGTVAGTFNLEGGTLIAGTVQGGSGTNTINARGGTFVSRGAVTLGNLNLGTTGTAAVMDINGLASGSRSIANYNHGAAGTLALRVNAYGPGVINATSATLASGSQVEVITPVEGVSTSPADQTRWTAGTAAWDAAHEHWSEGLPAGFTIADNTSYDFLQAGTLTDNGLSLVNPTGWVLSVGGGKATVTRNGDFTTGPVRALIDGSTAHVTRSQNLTVAESAGADAALLDIRAGSLTVGTVGDPRNLTLGSGSAGGELLQTGGAVTVRGNVIDGGNGMLNVHGGTMTVSGGLQAQSLAVGMEGHTGTLTAGGAVQLGNATSPGTLDIGRRVSNVTFLFTEGSLDLSGASSVTMALENLRLGTNAQHLTTDERATRGTLLLSPSNTIDAASIVVSDAPGIANYHPDRLYQSRIQLGADNTIRSDLILVAGRKGDGVIDVVPGGVLTLSGLTDARTDLRVGYNDTGAYTTGVNAVGHFDLRGASADTSLLVGDMVLGYAATGGTGGANGTFSMDAGTVDVTTLTMAHLVSGASPTGTFNLEGGTLIADTIQKGTGTANFNFTGGSLQVDDFLFDLVQDGSGAGFTPGGSSVGTSFIDGNYTLTSGTWEIQLDGSNSMSDLVQVYGALDLSSATTLDVGLLSAVTPGQTFVIASYGSLAGQFSVENLSALPDGSFVDYAYLGNSIAVTIIPEPSSLLLLSCLLAGWFSGFRPRRRAG